MEIWSKTADLAVSVAGKVLSKELGESDHRRLVEVAMGELPANGREGVGHDHVATVVGRWTIPVVRGQVAPELTRNYAEALLNAGGDRGRRRGRPSWKRFAPTSSSAQPGFAAILVLPSVSIADKDRILTSTRSRAGPCRRSSTSSGS